MSVAGCATRMTATTIEAQCAGWKPLAYNSKSKASPRYAARLLAKDIAVHNRRGQLGGCWR